MVKRFYQFMDSVGNVIGFTNNICEEERFLESKKYLVLSIFNLNNGNFAKEVEVTEAAKKNPCVNEIRELIFKSSVGEG
jgi:hypothetical protein